MRAMLRMATAAGAAAAAWALAQGAQACPVGKPVLANGSPGVAIRGSSEEGRPLCRVRFWTGVELDYESNKVLAATPADSRTERPIPGATLPIAAALRGGARLCRQGADVVYQGKRATVTSVRTEAGRRMCVLRPEGAPVLSLQSPETVSSPLLTLIEAVSLNFSTTVTNLAEARACRPFSLTILRTRVTAPESAGPLISQQARGSQP